MSAPTKKQKVAASIFGWIACLGGMLSSLATIICAMLYDIVGKNGTTVPIVVPTVIFALGASLVCIPLGVRAYFLGQKVLGAVGVVLCVAAFAITLYGGVSR